ncbi:MAG: hypothetical protein ACP5FT_04605 [Acidilobus sp.]
MEGLKVDRNAIDDLLTATESLLQACSTMNLRCRDPPLVTTRLLQHLSLTQYRQRVLWKFLEELSGQRFEIYKYVRAVFTISVTVERKKLLHIDGWVPVDFLDCRANQARCTVSPRGSAAFAYLEGTVEGSQVKINLINLLRILDMVKPQASREIVRAARNLLWGSDVESSLERIVDLTSMDVMKIVLPKVPSNPKDLLQLSPLLRASLKRA